MLREIRLGAPPPEAAEITIANTSSTLSLMRALLAAINCPKGEIEANLARHVAILHEAAEAGCDIARELYLGMLVDRASGRITVMASTEGGVEIETVAAETPEKIIKVWVDPATGLMPFQVRQIAFGLGFEGAALKQAARFIAALYKAYTQSDASLAEINPLVLTEQGDVVAVDAKINLDDNAL